MPELPTGTVTFLFTDIEGSTKLLDRFGAVRYAEALEEHRRVIRESVDRYAGVEIGTEGDAFFVAFSTAPDAFKAACRAQEELALGPIRVRMGLHTGVPLLTNGSYVGSDIHRAARIAAAGHGGQLLMSSATRALLDAAAPVKDLGPHRFKDLLGPERIYQAGDDRYPPLKALFETNLPIPPTPFLGRARELDHLVELLGRRDLRLLTLTGPGGIGKTRLALQAAAEVADDFPDGVFWVSFASLRDPDLVVGSIARAISSKDTDPASHIADKRMLCLLDNFEHVMGAASTISEFHARCPNLRLLVTSREVLNLAGEHRYTVPPLEQADAVALFGTLARARGNDIPMSDAVVELCARLDDLPLAIELAAARTALFSVEQLSERLGKRLDLLKGGRDADPRQETLRATVEWSYELLSAEERALFARLSVFAGGCTYEAAETICGADPDILQSLLDKSLLQHRDAGSVVRYWMLETLRSFAAERFEELTDAAEVRREHAAYYLALAESGERDLFAGRDQALWMNKLGDEHDNLRAALEWSRDAEPGTELRLGAALGRFWVLHGDWQEGARRLEEILAHASDKEDPAYLRALILAALIARVTDDSAAATSLAGEALSLSRQRDDARSAALALNTLTAVAGVAGDLERAEALGREGLKASESAGDTRTAAFVHFTLAEVFFTHGRLVEADSSSRRARDMFREIGHGEGAALALGVLGHVEIAQGDLEDARSALLEGLRLAVELGFRQSMSTCIEGLAALEPTEQRSATMAGIAERLREGIRVRPFVEDVHERTMARLSDAIGDDALRSARQAGASMTIEDAVAYALGDTG